MSTITKSVFRTKKIPYFNEHELFSKINAVIANGSRLHSISYYATPEATDTRSWAEIYYEEFT